MIRLHIVEAFNNVWAMGELSEPPIHLLKTTGAISASRSAKHQETEALIENLDTPLQ